MRYAAVAKFNREQSLHAMWQAFRARSFADQQLVELDAGVVRDLLNARYYESARGQFISQDPVFWEIGLTADGKKALANPQYVNAYAYSSDNPITSKDPSGRVGWDTAADIAVEYGGPLDAQLGSMMSSAMSRLTPAVVGVGGAVLSNISGVSLRISNGIKYGGEFDFKNRLVRMPSNLPDPTGNLGNDWKPGDPKDWKTWLDAAPGAMTVGGLGWATYQTVRGNATFYNAGYNPRVYKQSVDYSQSTGKPSYTGQPLRQSAVGRLRRDSRRRPARRLTRRVGAFTCADFPGAKRVRLAYWELVHLAAGI